jgi:SEC-C motif-containing protein
MKPLPCPCGSGRPFDDCCGPLLRGERAVPHAEALMRSRYTAFALGDTAWLLATWHPDTRPATLDLNEEPRTKWINLQVKACRVLDADHAEVDFVARCRIGGRAHRLQESSRFVREQGQWYYLDGDTGKP